MAAATAVVRATVFGTAGAAASIGLCGDGRPRRRESGEGRGRGRELLLAEGRHRHRRLVVRYWLVDNELLLAQHRHVVWHGRAPRREHVSRPHDHRLRRVLLLRRRRGRGRRRHRPVVRNPVVVTATQPGALVVAAAAVLIVTIVAAAVLVIAIPTVVVVVSFVLVQTPAGLRATVVLVVAAVHVRKGRAARSARRWWCA